MIYTVDDTLREIRISAPAENLTIEEARNYIDKVFAGTDIVNFAVRFMPNSNATRVPMLPGAWADAVEFRKDPTINNI